MTPASALQHIQETLAAQGDPIQVIESCRPHFITEAISWARHLAAWDEYAGQFTPQVLGIACVISQRAMTEFDLEFDASGRVRERIPTPSRPWQRKEPTLVFTLTINDQQVEVGYTSEYQPNGDDLFTFIGAGEIPAAHPLSDTGYWSHFARPEGVEACGGPEAYAARYAEAKLKGEDNAFDDVFRGARPEPMKGPARKPAARTHAEAVKVQPKPQQGMLF
jgi:hypothetical protein